MPFVNYVKEHTAFIEYAADNGLRPNEILVWEALFHIMNQRANGNYWPDGFIRVKNDRLLTYAPIGFDSLSRARNALAQRGLIAYKPGKRNTDVPMYELHYLTAAVNPQLHDEPADNPADKSHYSACCPQFADNIGGNMRDNIGGNMRDNIGGNMGYQYININNKRNETYTDDDDDEDDDLRARARMEPGEEEFEALKLEIARCANNAFKQCFGRFATPEEASRLAHNAVLLDIGPDLLSRAIRIAAKNGAENPFSYVMTILKDWHSQYVTTATEADEYEADRDAAEGRMPLSRGFCEDDWKQLEEHREARKRKHAAAKGGGDSGGYPAPGI